MGAGRVGHVQRRYDHMCDDVRPVASTGGGVSILSPQPAARRPQSPPQARATSPTGARAQVEVEPTYRVWDFDLAEGDRGVYVIGFPTADRPNSTYVGH